MKRYKPIKEQTEKSLNKLKQHFHQRTTMHINFVKKYANKILLNKDISKLINTDAFLKDVTTHDSSKFEEPEYTPYLFITWEYKLKRSGVKIEFSDALRDKMHKATEHHVLTNKHHPQYWSPVKTNIINKYDRDMPTSQIIDATTMPLEYVAHMTCDWMAMSEELNDNPFDWANKNINIRWKFTKEQTTFIYLILNKIWTSNVV